MHPVAYDTIIDGLNMVFRYVIGVLLMLNALKSFFVAGFIAGLTTANNQTGNEKKLDDDVEKDNAIAHIKEDDQKLISGNPQYESKDIIDQSADKSLSQSSAEISVSPTLHSHEDRMNLNVDSEKLDLIAESLESSKEIPTEHRRLSTSSSGYNTSSISSAAVAIPLPNLYASMSDVKVLFVFYTIMQILKTK